MWIEIKLPHITAKAVVRGNLIALNPYMRKEGKCQINNLSSYQKNLEKQEQNKSKSSRRKEIITMRVEPVKLKTNKKSYRKSMKPKTVSLK